MKQNELKPRRLAVGMSLSQLAARAGCSAAYLHQLENQEAKTKRTASPEKLQELEQVLVKAATAKAAGEAAAAAVWAS